MKYALSLLSIAALFILAVQAVPEAEVMQSQDAEIEGFMKKLKEDLAKAEQNEDTSIESFADEQQITGKSLSELEKLMEAEIQNDEEGLEQADDVLAQAGPPGGGSKLQQWSETQQSDSAKAQGNYYRYYVYYYRLYCRWRHYYYNLLKYYKSYRHLYYTYRRLYYRCVHRHRG